MFFEGCIRFGLFAVPKARRRAELQSNIAQFHHSERRIDGTVPQSNFEIPIADAGGIYLLFSATTRPDLSRLREAVAQVDDLTISREAALSDSAETEWAELVFGGLTFDVLGLSPGMDTQFPQPRHVAGELRIEDMSGVKGIFIQAGPHLAGSENALSIMKALCQVAAALGKRLAGLEAYLWPAANSLIAPELFRGSIERWVKVGVFPTPGLIVCRNEIDGALLSEGLAFFTGQELRLEPDLIDDPDIAVRLAARLVGMLVQRSKLTKAEEVIGPDGNMLRLKPSKNGRYIRVWRG